MGILIFEEYDAGAFESKKNRQRAGSLSPISITIFASVKRSQRLKSFFETPRTALCSSRDHFGFDHLVRRFEQKKENSLTTPRGSRRKLLLSLGERRVECQKGNTDGLTDTSSNGRRGKIREISTEG